MRRCVFTLAFIVVGLGVLGCVRGVDGRGWIFGGNCGGGGSRNGGSGAEGIEIAGEKRVRRCGITLVVVGPDGIDGGGGIFGGK